METGTECTSVLFFMPGKKDFGEGLTNQIYCVKYNL